NFEKQELNENAITFTNTTHSTPDYWLMKLIRSFYKKPVNYHICYWYGMTGMITISLDFLQFHLIFASRLIEAGRAEIMTILMTKKRLGIFGRLHNHLVLWLSKFVAEDFIKDDNKIFQTIQFNLKSPIDLD
ncbi:MAG: aromatic ring-hydroxylating dioxygenase subunit alpha, partial [bacterium]